MLRPYRGLCFRGFSSQWPSSRFFLKVDEPYLLAGSSTKGFWPRPTLVPSSRRYAKRALASRRIGEEDTELYGDYESEEETESYARGVPKKPSAPLEVKVPPHPSPKSLSAATGVGTVSIIKTIIKMGYPIETSTEVLPEDVVDLILAENNFIPIRSKTGPQDVERFNAAAGKLHLKKRPPVVTLMGHVNHGKTSLLDALRQSKVAATEAGLITQAMSASHVNLGGQALTFIDTPGHLAFSSMRARGSRLTDIVVLVVAADEGVMAQTEEALTHIRSAGDVPMIVAINKCEKKNANPQMVRTQLLQRGVMLEEFGGDVQCVEVSAKEGTNMSALTDAVVLLADMMDLKANPDVPAETVVFESRIDKGLGPVVTVLVKQGTVKINNWFVVGETYGRVRSLLDSAGRACSKAGPSVPVSIVGLKSRTLPNPGEELLVVAGEQKAKEVLEFRREVRVEAERKKALEPAKEADLEQDKQVNIIVKADSKGSLQAVLSLLDFPTAEGIKVNPIKTGVGVISSSDIAIAKGAQALVVGFKVSAEAGIEDLAHTERVQLAVHDVIYDIYEAVKSKVEEKLPPVDEVVGLGGGTVLRVFSIGLKKGRANVAGVTVTRGVIDRRCRVRVLRPNANGDNDVVFDGAIASLKKFKKDTAEVKKGEECGLAFEGFEDVREKDIIECYRLDKKPRKLATTAWQTTGPRPAATGNE